MTAIAKLGCNTSTTACSANRKFMFAPSVVSSDGQTFSILLGSGDREKPIGAYVASRTVANYFFMIKDEPATANYPNQSATCNGENVICLASLHQIARTNPDTSGISSKRGWYLVMNSTEQVVTSAVTIFGVTTFSTHQPAVATNSCSNNLGTTLVYNLKYDDASTTSSTGNLAERVSGDGLPPSPVAGKVLINGEAVPFCIGCSKESPLEGKKAVQASSVLRPRNRLYWFIERK